MKRLQVERPGEFFLKKYILTAVFFRNVVDVMDTAVPASLAYIAPPLMDATNPSNVDSVIVAFAPPSIERAPPLCA